MKIKPGADIKGLDISMRPVLMTADAIWSDLGQELVITAGLDGEHSAGSLHYYGLAVDVRTRDFSEEQKKKAFEALKSTLGITYDVVWHKSHIHIEHDPI